MSTNHKKLKKKAGATESPKKKVEIVDRHIRIPRELDEWLVTFTERGQFNSEVDAIRHLMREARNREVVTA
jgi:hypothetical protein